MKKNDSNNDGGPQEISAYGGYSGGYAGYSAVGYGNETTAHRTFQDYLLILRERIWYVVVVFLVVFSSALVYTLGQTKVYEGVATVEIFRKAPNVLSDPGNPASPLILDPQDLNTQVQILSSLQLVNNVASRLSSEEVRDLLAPYETGRATDPKTPQEILMKNRDILPQRLSLIVAISFRHPDKVLAAKVANLFADEYIAYNSRTKLDMNMVSLEDLKVREEQQQRKVDDLMKELQDYKDKYGVSLDDSKNIVVQRLKDENALLTQTSATRAQAENRWKQVQKIQANQGDLTELGFVAQNETVATLKQALASQRVQVAQLKDHYRAKHPKMIEAMNTLNQIETEYAQAIKLAASNVESDYDNAMRNEQQAQQSVDKAEQTAKQLERDSSDYITASHELDVNNLMLAKIQEKIRELTLEPPQQSLTGRVLDHASEGQDPVSPKVPLNLAIGFLGGVVLGLGFAFFVAFIDDRVKSSFDIESVVGVQLIGVIPQIKRMDQSDKAQIVINNADRQVSEAFLALHSTLRLKDEGKNAKCILVTSTIPGEGKSFTTTNLALTFAAHGERTIILDCDLRKPNIHKSFRVENLRGVIDICAGTMKVDDVVVQNIHPNLDIVPAGGRAKNPTQILNSKNFDIMLSELRQRYDRIFIDTPPLAAVSDALVLLPLVDASIFTILFNRVRRKAVQYAAKKLLEANVPNLGAVLNGLNLAVSGYYYAQYYDKSYKDYYVVSSQEEEASVPEEETNG